MKSRYGLLAIVLAWVPAMIAPAADADTLEILRSDETGFAARFTTPDFEVRPLDDGFSEIRAPGMSPNQPPGRPSLPVRGVLLSVPRGARPAVRIDRVEHVRFIHARPAPVAKTEYPGTESESSTVDRARRATGPNRFIHAASYSAKGFRPTDPVVINGAGAIRASEFVRLEIRPFSYDGSSGRVRVASEISFTVEFHGAEAAPGSIDRARAAGPAAFARDRTPATAPRQVPDGPPRAFRPEPSLFANADQSMIFRRPVVEDAAGVRGVPDWANEAFRIGIDDDGVYALTPDDVRNAGGNAAADPRRFQMFHLGQEIPIEVEGEQDGVFDVGDRIVFYARKSRTRWSDRECYFLVLQGNGPGRRMGQTGSFSANLAAAALQRACVVSFHVEKNEFLMNRMPCGFEKDDWMDQDYLLTAQVELTSDVILDFDVDAAFMSRVKSSNTGTIRGRLVAWPLEAAFDPENLVEVSLNGTQVGADVSWTLARAADCSDKEFEVTFPASRLHAGSNTIEFHQPVTQDPRDPPRYRKVHVDSVDIDVPVEAVVTGDHALLGFPWSAEQVIVVGAPSAAYRLYNVSVPESPIRITSVLTASMGPGWPASLYAATSAKNLTGGRVDVLFWEEGRERTPALFEKDTPSDLHGAGNRGEYVIIADTEFIPALLDPASGLAAYRGSVAGGGFEVLVVSVQDVFDEFSAGNVRPEAIRDFLAVALSSWSLPPVFVLLVGDSSIDFKNHRGFSGPEYTRPFFVPSLDYAMLDPVAYRTPSDPGYSIVVGGDPLPDLFIGRIAARSAGDVIDATAKIKAYEAAPSAPWTRRVLMLADDDLVGTGDDCLAPGYVDSWFDLSFVPTYLAGTAPGDLVRMFADTYPNGTGLRTALFSELNAGVGVLYYAGHGSTVTLGAHCADVGLPPYFMKVTDGGLLTNADRLPVAVMFTCSSSDFDYVEYYTGPPFTNQLKVRSVGETFAIQAGGGFIAAVGSTGPMNTLAGWEVMNGFADAVESASSPYLPPLASGLPRDHRLLGPLFFASLARVYEQLGEGDPAGDPPGVGGARDHIFPLVLLGDPALRLNLP